MKKPFVSIVVRSKNEKIWIIKCLNEIYGQNYKNFEVILVDNNSSDGTPKIAKSHFPKLKVINYKSKQFFPGQALNLGIKKTKGTLIGFISGHCIPKNSEWIKNLVKNFSNKKIAACYGRQEPSNISDPEDVRDLTYLFGLDKKIQTTEPFFHNANSMIRKSLWSKVKFDETVRHIEDRIWSSRIISSKTKIVYEPKASVIHFHGVGHHSNITRVNTISKILVKKSSSTKNRRKIIAIIPVKKPIFFNNKFVIFETLNELIKIREIEKIFISTSDKKLKKLINHPKVTIINRDKDLEKDFLGTEYILSKIYKRSVKKFNPTHILVAEEIYINRQKDFFKNLINNFSNEFDTIVPIIKNNSHNIWKKNKNGDLDPIFKTNLPSEYAENEIYEEVKGLGTLTSSSAFEIGGRESSFRKLVEVKRINSITTKDVLLNE